MFLEAPAGHWMCSMCAQAERDGKNMTEHDLEDDDNAAMYVVSLAHNKY